jgi:hypothetical protein
VHQLLPNHNIGVIEGHDAPDNALGFVRRSPAKSRKLPQFSNRNSLITGKLAQLFCGLEIRASRAESLGDGGFHSETAGTLIIVWYARARKACSRPGIGALSYRRQLFHFCGC